VTDGLIRIGELARRANVPLATVKHYLREGLIQATRKSGKTMSWYDPALVERLRAIKELQQRQFLPLEVIKESIHREGIAQDDLAAADAIAKVLAKHGGSRSRTREDVVARGADARELEWLEQMGLAVPYGPEKRYKGDDLALLQTLASARKAGIDAQMLPFSVLERYLSALRTLVAVELEMFRAGVFPRAGREHLEGLTIAATQLSERLVVLLRRKLLLPTLSQIAEETPHAKRQARSTSDHRGVRRQHRPATRRR
jgi:DNA-binding transcriptional MerR regulator